MPFNKPLKFKVASRRDFHALFVILFLLILMSMAAEPWPLILILAIVLLSGAGVLINTLRIHKTDDVDLISVIFPDGRVTLESATNTRIEGLLSGDQWSTRHITVLRYQAGGKRQQIVLLSAHQHSDDYRRLKIWLRQSSFTEPGNAPVSLIEPVMRD